MTSPTASVTRTVAAQTITLFLSSTQNPRSKSTLPYDATVGCWGMSVIAW